MREITPKAVAFPGARRSAPLISYDSIGVIVAVIDFFLIVTACVAGGLLYHYVALDYVPDPTPLLVIGYNFALAFMLVQKSRGLYGTTALLSFERQARGIIFAWTVLIALLTSILFLLKIGASLSRGSMVAFSALSLVLLLAARGFTARAARQALASGLLAGRRAIVIGERDELLSSSVLRDLKQHGTREVGRFELSRAKDGLGFSARDLDVIESAIQSARINRANEILLALPWTDSVRRDLICEFLRSLPLPVFLLADRFVNSMPSHSLLKMGSTVAVELQRAPISRPELALKRGLDIALSAAVLILLLPLLTLVALAIMLDSPGPIIFRQRRKGFNGEVFTIYKFRTMSVLEDGSTIRQATRDDDRVTPVGRILRATSIDELPQLINVIQGQMSLVGPRPHAMAHDTEFSKKIANYAFRHHVKPGITGWAQVNGYRGETPDLQKMEKRVELDLWYVNNWSIWLDLRILGQTILEVFRRRNAY